MTNLRIRQRRLLGSPRGFDVIELMVGVAIIGSLAAIAIPLYANVQARARLAKAEADARALASAVSIYSAHVGSLPGNLTDLTSVITNAQGQAGGPFLASVDPESAGWGKSYDLGGPPSTFKKKKAGEQSPGSLDLGTEIVPSTTTGRS